jgi:hypothetical protein
MSLGFQRTRTRPLFRQVGETVRDGGRIQFGPGITGREAEAAALAQQAGAGLSQAVGQFGGQISGLREAAIGTLPEFVEAQVAPLQQEIARQRGAFARETGLRRLGGSAFREQAGRLAGLEQAEALGRARAGALMGGVGQIAGLSQMELGARQLEAQGRIREAEMMRALAAQQAQRELAITQTGQESMGLQFGLRPQTPGGGTE